MHTTVLAALLFGAVISIILACHEFTQGNKTPAMPLLSMLLWSLVIFGGLGVQIAVGDGTVEVFDDGVCVYGGIMMFSFSLLMLAYSMLTQ